MRHAISVLLENEVGALTRMTGMFSSRGFNIESLNVAPTNEPTVSRVTLVVSGSDAAISQLNTQLAKLVDVVNIHDMTLGAHFEKELVIVKLKLGTGGLARAMKLVKDYKADILDDAPLSCTLQLTGSVGEVDDFIVAAGEIGDRWWACRRGDRRSPARRRRSSSTRRSYFRCTSRNRLPRCRCRTPLPAECC